MKRVFLLSMLIMLMLFYGCAAIQDMPPSALLPTTEVLQPTESTIIATEESTEATTVETTNPIVFAVEEENITYIEAVDAIPQFSSNADSSFVLEADGNEHFSASYIHTAVETTQNRTPFDGQFFWVPRSEEDAKYSHGNHFDIYLMEDGKLQKLESQSFSQQYTLFGRSVLLELEYVLYDDQLLLTYVPAENWDDNMANVVDTSRGVHECLVRFQMIPKDKDERYYCYYALVDLVTGVLTDILADFDANLIAGRTFDSVQWVGDHGLLMRTGSTFWQYLDLEKHTVQQYDVATLLPGITPNDVGYTPDCVVLHTYTNKMKTKSAVWRIDFESNAVTQILSDVLVTDLEENLSYMLYRDEEMVFHVYDLASGEDIPIPGMRGRDRCTENFITFIDAQKVLWAYDVQEKALAKLCSQADYGKGSMESPDGRKLLLLRNDSGVYQFLVFLGDTNEVIALKRENPNKYSEQVVRWGNNNELIVGDYQNFCRYIFKIH